MRCITGQYRKPYSEHKTFKFDFQIMIQTAKNGLRPAIHSSCPPPFAELMQRSWDADPDKRPTMAEVLAKLQTIKDLFEKERAARTTV